MSKFDSERELVLCIKNVGKDYMLGAVTGETLKSAIRNKRGKSENNEKNRSFTALDDINIDIYKGEVVGIIGANGAGKSTLLKLITRITAPTRGKIMIDGRVASMLEVGTGFHPELTGRENIYLNGSILGMSRKEIDSKLDSIIEFSEIGEFIDTPVKRYSSGMYVKLAFSVAAHLDSEIMIMDEVLAVGDVNFQHKCLSKMREIAETENRTILYVSHNMDTIHTLCDRCIFFDKGHILFDGDVDEAVKLYLGYGETTNHDADFTKYIRPGWLSRDDARLTWAEYVDKSDNVVVDDDLLIRFRWHNNSDIHNLGIRVELMGGSRQPFATAAFSKIYSGKANEDGQVEVSVNLSKVKNGIYQTYYTLYSLDETGESIEIDCVNGIEIEIRRVHDLDELKWRNSSWGNVEL